MMIIFALLFLFIAAGVAGADPFLAVDKPSEDVEITKTWVEYKNLASGVTASAAGGVTIQGNDMLVLDLATLPAGKYEFRVKWAETLGWWSDYSDPFVAGKPAKSGIPKIVVKPGG